MKITSGDRIKLLFWNTNNKPLIEEISELIESEHCNINAFAETDEETMKKVISILNKKHGTVYYQYNTPGCDRIKLILKFPINNISLLNQHKYFSLVKIDLPKSKIILGFVHFPSKIYHTQDEIRRASEILCTQIATEENRHDIENSLIIGDFNVDPFETPMISLTGMAATNGIECSRRDTVTRAAEKRKLFYNPMWVLYSKNRERPGSFKYSRPGEDVISWHFLDQVVIRPSLIEYFNFDSLNLIKGTVNFNYLNKNLTPVLSDHLPLTCQLDI